MTFPAVSVNDPVFWMHHAFVDLCWTRWQRRHRVHRYLPAEPPRIGDEQRGRILAPRPERELVRPDRLVAEVLLMREHALLEEAPAALGAF